MLGGSVGFYLFPPGGQWKWHDQRTFCRVRNALLTGIGIPRGFEGAVYFTRDELDQLAGAVFARSFMLDQYCGDCSDDSWIYPAHGRLYLHFDDEEITWGMAAGTEARKRFDEEIIRRGWGWLRRGEGTAENPWIAHDLEE